MNVSKLTTVAISVNKEIKHATIKYSSFSERRTHVVPQLILLRKAWQEESRDWFANQLERVGVLTGVFNTPVNWAELAEAYAPVYLAYEEAVTASGLTTVDSYKPALLSLPLPVLTGGVEFVEFSTINGLREELRNMTVEQLQSTYRMLVSAKHSAQCEELQRQVLESLADLRVYRFDREADQEVSESALERLYTYAAKREGKGKAGAARFLRGEPMKASAFRGCLSATLALVVDVYAGANQYLQDWHANTMARAEAEYVVKDGGASYLIQSKDGDRPGMASGRKTGKEVAEAIEQAIYHNEIEYMAFMNHVLEIIPVELRRDMGEIQIMWGDNPRYLPEAQDALYQRINSIREYNRTKDLKKEVQHQDRVAAQFAAAENVAKIDKAKLLADIFG